MPTWGELLQEFQHANDPQWHDKKRKSALANLAKLTGRPTVIYASRWVQGDVAHQTALVNIEDVQAFMEVLHGIQGEDLDIILHSSGGSPTAAEAVVRYIRTKFKNVRVIVPMAAMSAATLMACSANRLLMGRHSFLGPIDPQLVLQTPLGPSAVPAQLIIRQFERAEAIMTGRGVDGETVEPVRIGAWTPMLHQYGPALLEVCRNALALSEELAERWLSTYMFAEHDACGELAAAVAQRLNDHEGHHSHGRFLHRDDLKNLGMVIDDLEESQALQDAVLTVLHAYTITFQLWSPVQKLVESPTKSFARIVGKPVQVPEHDGEPDLQQILRRTLGRGIRTIRPLLRQRRPR